MTAVGKIDWAKLATKLKPETMAQVNAFRSRHVALLKQVAELKEQENGIKFDNYKSLKNQAVVSEAKKALESFKPAKFDLTKQLEVIESAKKEDIETAKKTLLLIKEEAAELKQLLVNIENARPIDQILVDDVAKAYPKLDQTVEKMAKRGQWKVPGYYESFGEFKVGF